MQIESLTLNDFGLFHGEHVINLSAQKNQGTIKPIILFGGLNGSGKTTILTSIRLAIYGKQALGYGVSQKVYDNFLISKVHRNSDLNTSADRASITIDFLYFKLGKPIKYQVRRSWLVDENKVTEILSILQDNEPIPQFSAEQCQAFLNELIPLGVSDLFFFDGEKIAELAEEGGDIALRDAIRKLLGLDIIERLNSDLHIYVRKINNKSLPNNEKSKLEQYETELEGIKSLIEEQEAEVQAIHPQLTEANEFLGRLEDKLNSRGGAWASSRQTLKDKRDKLIEEKKNLEIDVREFLNGLYPLSLATQAMKELKLQLRKERALKDWESVAEAVTQKLGSLNSVVTQFTPRERHNEALSKIKEVFSDLISRPSDLQSTSLLHDLASKEYIQLENLIDVAVNQVAVIRKQLQNQLSTIDEDLSNVSLQIERAPDKESLQEDLNAIKEKNQLIIELTSKKNTHLELAKRFTWQALELVRKMRRLESSRSSNESNEIGIHLANKTRNVLSDFVSEITKRKVQKLEQEFADTFSRLARKSDAIVKAKIDPVSFNVLLFNMSGNIIPKQDLSAGEKQIYAVAMLEALAKTSGRKLPIIIDTPLGRLDSHHREKLINNYFPYASHQVIILSTDTEVDRSFYNGLYKHVSHSYQISYNEVKGSSEIKEGYFWEANFNDDGDIAHAA